LLLQDLLRRFELDDSDEMLALLLCKLVNHIILLLELFEALLKEKFDLQEVVFLIVLLFLQSTYLLLLQFKDRLLEFQV